MMTRFLVRIDFNGTLFRDAHDQRNIDEKANHPNVILEANKGEGWKWRSCERGEGSKLETTIKRIQHSIKELRTQLKKDGLILTGTTKDGFEIWERK